MRKLTSTEMIAQLMKTVDALSADIKEAVGEMEPYFVANRLWYALRDEELVQKELRIKAEIEKG